MEAGRGAIGPPPQAWQRLREAGVGCGVPHPSQSLRELANYCLIAGGGRACPTPHQVELHRTCKVLPGPGQARPGDQAGRLAG